MSKGTASSDMGLALPLAVISVCVVSVQLQNYSLLPPFQVLHESINYDCEYIEDCYGFNVKIFGCKNRRCLYLKNTYTTCKTDVECRPIARTFCDHGYCSCTYRHGISKFESENCVLIPALRDRWKYEAERFPERIIATEAWGDNGEYPFVVQYSAFIGISLVCGLVGMIAEYCRAERLDREISGIYGNRLRRASALPEVTVTNLSSSSDTLSEDSKFSHSPAKQKMKKIKSKKPGKRVATKSGEATKDKKRASKQVPDSESDDQKETLSVAKTKMKKAKTKKPAKETASGASSRESDTESNEKKETRIKSKTKKTKTKKPAKATKETGSGASSRESDTDSDEKREIRGKSKTKKTKTKKPAKATKETGSGASSRESDTDSDEKKEIRGKSKTKKTKIKKPAKAMKDSASGSKHDSDTDSNASASSDGSVKETKKKAKKGLKKQKLAKTKSSDEIAVNNLTTADTSSPKTKRRRANSA